MDDSRDTAATLHRLIDMSESNPALFETLLKIIDTLTAKANDYSAPGRPFWSIEETARTAQIEPDAVFRALIAVKTSREQALMQRGKKAACEPLQDTRLDRACYCILQTAYHLQNVKEDPNT